jgi:hypothetical protein
MTRVTVTDLFERAGEQRFDILLLHKTLGIRNRIAVRVGLRLPEHLVDAIDQTIETACSSCSASSWTSSHE